MTAAAADHASRSASFFADLPLLAATRDTFDTGRYRPAPDDWLEVYPVSTRVNTPDNNDADLLQRVEPDTLL